MYEDGDDVSIDATAIVITCTLSIISISLLINYISTYY